MPIDTNYKEVIENLNMGVLIQGPKSEVLMNNSKVLELLGLTKNQLYKGTSFDSAWDVINEDGTSSFGSAHAVSTAILNRQPVKNLILGVCRPNTKDRVWLSVNSNPIFDNKGNLDFVITMFYDVTEEINLKIKNKYLNRLYSFVSKVNQMIIKTFELEELLKEFCRIAVETGGFKMVCISKLDVDTLDIIPQSFYGEEDGYLSKIKITLDKTKDEGNGPTANAIRDGKFFLCNDFNTALVMQPWREEALKRNYQSSIAFPIKIFGEMYGAIMFYSPIKNYFNDEEIKLIEEVTNDLAFQMENIEREKGKIQAEIQVKYTNRLYLFVNHINDLILKTYNEEELFNGFCRIATEVGGFKFAWVGFINELTERIVPHYYAGEEQGYLSVIKDLSINANEAQGNGPSGRSVRERKSIFVNDAETGFAVTDWRAEAKKRGFRSVLSIPIIKFGEVIGVIIFYSSIKNYFDESETDLLNRITNNISFQLENIEKEREMKNLQIETEFTNRRLRLANKISKLGIWELDLKTNLYWASNEAKMIYGFEGNEEEFDSEIVRKCCLDRTVIEKAYKDLITEEKPFDIEFEIQPLNSLNKKLIHSIADLVKDENGTPIKISGVFKDITELKKSEEKNRQLLMAVEQSPASIVITDTDGNILHVNQRFIDITGYSYDEAIGANPRILKSGEKPAEEYKQLWDTITRGQVWHGEFHNKKKDGSFYWENASISPLINEQGEIVNFVAVKEDITERRKIERDLINSENKFKQLIEQSPISYELYDRNGLTKSVNTAYEKLWGIPREYVIDKYNILKSEPIREGGWLPYFERVFAGEYLVLPYVKYDTSKDEITKGEGLSKWVSTKAYPIKDENGQVQNVVVLHEDVTERKEADEKLVNSEKRYHSLISDLHVGVVLNDSKSKILLANNRALELLGLTEDQLLGKTSFDEDWNVIHEDGSPYPGSTHPIPQSIATRKPIWNAVMGVYRPKTKDRVWLLVNADPQLNADGSVNEVICTFEDITERKLSEQQSNDLFNLSTQAMWLYDLDTFNFIKVNKAAIENYGYSEEEFLKMTVIDIMPESEIIKKRIFVDKIKSNFKVSNTQKFLHQKKSGEIFEVETYSNVIISEGKKLGSVINIDITEKIRTENAINKAILKAQEDERYEMGGELHDNISQILVASQMSLALLKKSIDPSKIELYNQCRNYTTLALAEIRSLSHRLAPVFFEGKTLEDSFKILLSEMNQEERYKFEVFFDKEFEKIKIRPEIKLNLYRILQEQIKNILKHSKATFVEVEIKVIKNVIILRIKDNGIGFNVNTTSEGIGLSNIKRRAESFAGKMDIQSSPGNGCIVEINIPIKG